MPPHTSGRRLGGPLSQTNSMLDARQSLSSYLSSSNSSNRLLNRKLLAPQFRPSEISPTMLATSSNFSTVKNLTKENSKPKSRRTVQGDLCRCKMSLKRYFPTTNSLKWASVRRPNSKLTQSLPTWKWAKRTVRSRISWCTPIQTLMMTMTLWWTKGIRTSQKAVREKTVRCGLRSKEICRTMSAAVKPTAGVRGTTPARNRANYMIPWKTIRWLGKR